VNKSWLDKEDYSTKSPSTLHRSKHWAKGLITPLPLVNRKGVVILSKPKSIYTMDLETIKLNNIQVPIAISCCGEYGSKLFLIDDLLLLRNIEEALNKLWSQYFTYLESFITDEINNLTIFAHNLGDFDGYFLYKALMNHYNPEYINSIIDESNSFISIKYKTKDIVFEWKDSLRIFPMSLDNLCKLFGVQGKVTSYNPKFNDISLFNNPRLFSSFKKYALQDAVGLYQAITMAQIIYFNKFKVDVTTVVSSPTLSLKIFRSNFLSLSIPVLSREIDEFVRFGYYGGGTDYYKAYETNLKYYDVNSLYPLAMKNPMPLNLIKYHKNMDHINLKNFFGFIEVEVTCPTTMLRPVLPFKVDGKTIYPVGNWTAIYFSEELKAVQSLGYKFRLIRGYEFSKVDLFSKYVDHFFNIKRTSQGSEKAIAKLHLNALYGYFGRRQDLIETINVTNESLPKYLSSRIVKEILKINDDYSTLLLSANINHKVLRNLNMICESNIQSSNRIVMSNVTIAAAVTAYARMHMIYYKLLPGTVYTDTDSIFTTDILSEHLIGSDLGQMKDELNGTMIEEGLFLGLKNMVIMVGDNLLNKLIRCYIKGN
jgi:hypothetical protein